MQSADSVALGQHAGQVIAGAMDLPTCPSTASCRMGVTWPARYEGSAVASSAADGLIRTTTSTAAERARERVRRLPG